MGESFAEIARGGPMLVAIGVAALAGLVSFLSPCVLPLVPGYLSYVTGLAGADLDAQLAARRGRVAIGTLLFVAGFTVVFTLTAVLVTGVGNALFADGSAAVVGAPAAEGERAWRVVDTGSCLFPDSEYAMSWEIGDHGFDMMLSTKVPNLIQQNLRPWMEQWLGANGLTIKEVGSWAIHPGGPRILSSVEEAIGLAHGTAEASRRVLSAHGNMSSPTVLFIVNELRRTNAPRPCVALGFGPGLVAEAALFR